MTNDKKILILPGDGIGLEVMNEVLNVIDWFAKNKSISFDISERLVGGSAYDKEGNSISDATMDQALKNAVYVTRSSEVRHADRSLRVRASLGG